MSQMEEGSQESEFSILDMSGVEEKGELRSRNKWTPALNKYPEF